MAATLSLSFPSLEIQNRFFTTATPSKTRPFYPSTPPLHNNHKYYPLPNNPHFKISSSSSSHSSSPSPTTLDADPFYRPGRFLTNEELQRLDSLEGFLYSHELESGSVWVRVMRDDEVDPTVRLLAESFAESMMFPSGYVNVLRFLVKQYLMERRALMPHMATLVGFYRGVAAAEDDGEGGNGEEVQLAGTVEVCFDKRGANASLPSPTPPKDSPYICNMAVQKSLRRYLLLN